VGGIHSENCRASGMDVRLSKPVDPIALIDAVGSLLAVSSTTQIVNNSSRHAESEAAIEKESKKDDPMLIPDSESQMPIVHEESRDVFDPMELWERVGGDPEVFERLIGLFGRRAPDHVAKMKAASDAGDASAVRAEAHSLKGSAANMSAHNTSSLAGQIEQAAVHGNLEAVGPLLLKLDWELSILQQALMSQKCPA
jgi:two-component system, sensor histidine kinase and response regulator